LDERNYEFSGFKVGIVEKSKKTERKIKYSEKNNN
jgi:hypothetical protein